LVELIEKSDYVLIAIRDAVQIVVLQSLPARIFTRELAYQ
jgi:hypothetical protein